MAQPCEWPPLQNVSSCRWIQLQKAHLAKAVILIMVITFSWSLHSKVWSVLVPGCDCVQKYVRYLHQKKGPSRFGTLGYASWDKINRTCIHSTLLLHPPECECTRTEARSLLRHGYVDMQPSFAHEMWHTSAVGSSESSLRHNVCFLLHLFWTHHRHIIIVYNNAHPWFNPPQENHLWHVLHAWTTDNHYASSDDGAVSSAEMAVVTFRPLAFTRLSSYSTTSNFLTLLRSSDAFLPYLPDRLREDSASSTANTAARDLRTRASSRLDAASTAYRPTCGKAHVCFVNPMTYRCTLSKRKNPIMYTVFKVLTRQCFASQWVRLVSHGWGRSGSRPYVVDLTMRSQCINWRKKK